jgi:tetratricopeptide (TPR) repeat protein
VQRAPTSTPAAEVFCHSNLSLAHRMAGNAAAAWSAAEYALGLSRETGTFRHLESEILTHAARAQILMGDPVRALECLEPALERAHQLSIRTTLVDLHLTRAIALRAEGNTTPDVLDAELERALAVADEVAAHGLVPEIHLERAAVAALRDDGEVRYQQIERARSLYADMKCELQVAKIGRELAGARR